MKNFREALAAWSLMIASALLIMGSAVLAQQGTGVLPGGQGTYGPPVATLNGHVAFGNGVAPALSGSCGTGAIPPVGTDAAFQFTTGTSAGNCVVTPAVLYPAKRPTCLVDTESATKPAFTVDTQGRIAIASAQSSVAYYVVCFAQPGGA